MPVCTLTIRSLIIDVPNFVKESEDTSCFRFAEMNEHASFAKASSAIFR